MKRRKRDRKQMSGTGRSRWYGRVLAFFLIVAVTAGGMCFSILAEDPDTDAAGQANERQGAADMLPDDLGELYAKSAVLMDAESGRVLISKDGDTMRPMASTTKIMTCILALEEGNPEDVVTASGEASSQPKVHLGMTEGEQFALGDLLYSLMLESHNDSAVAIAEHIAGSVPEFADKMNAKAKEIGCGDAHFVSPNGLDSSDEGGAHSISAADLALIMSYCVSKSPKSSEFLKITQTSSYSFTDKEGKRSFSCGNHNLFLTMMEGAISGKTGFTGDAGYCYVGALKRDGKTFTVALLGCGWPNNKNYKWADTKKLMNYGLEHYEYRNIWQEPEVMDIPVKNGIASDGSLSGEAKAAVRLDTEETELQVLLGDREEVKVSVAQDDMLTAPVMEGQLVGTVTYYLGDRQLKEYPLVADSDVESRTLKWYMEKVFTCWLDFSACSVILK